MINQLREPLHDEVLAAVFRIEGEELSRVDAGFENEILHADTLSVRSAARRDEWIRTLRGRWFHHRDALNEFLAGQEKSLQATMDARAKSTLARERAAAKASYESRLKELEDRSREREMKKLAEALLREQAEAPQPMLFEELQEQVEFRVQELEQQITVLRRDVEETRAQLIRERDHRLKELLPKRFEIRDVRVLPLAVEYVIPASGEDLP